MAGADSVLPDQVAREAADTSNGEAATAIEPERQNDRPVCLVSVLGIGDEAAMVHVVDARTGEILGRRPA